MADDITLAELGRRIEAMARDVHDDLADMRMRQEQYVLQRVYAAEQATLQLRLTQLEQQVKEAQDQRRADRDKAEEQRRGTSRWLVAAIVVPTLTALATLLLPLVVA